MQSALPAVENSQKLVRSWPGWSWIDLDAPHDVMVTNPDKLVRILVDA
jgi:hypothetical protein